MLTTSGGRIRLENYTINREAEVKESRGESVSVSMHDNLFYIVESCLY